ncbi:unnamed protein product [Rotaria magnacalcarata]|uniref:Uncharacterized protein n=1 Tax=Rotaria magnacalcarata TaxID=392030 RepID=A0A819WDH5_9BILA|nr:unnamed protein product [Rotaria magnacalcarata]CAF2228752.1 unnamed protein product [Rotaria magnacalcarata]CAF3822948.1 unnamed protein product [Rotaria magnacalcarata]CAF4122960.1 unnamed protein product [Rotaria magnacalcarata]
MVFVADCFIGNEIHEIQAPRNFSPYSKFIVHRFVKYLLSMKLTAAQKQKRYRENLKRKGRHNTMKAKNRERMQNFRSKSSDFQREQYRNHDAAACKRARAASKHQSKYVFLRILITGSMCSLYFA